MIVCSALLAACAPDDGGPLAIAGSYLDPFGTTHDITDTDWVQTYGAYVTAFAIVSYDNDEMYLIAQNDDANGYNPGLWSRFDWAEADGELSYCQTVFDALTEQDALDTPRASDAGCGGFPWSALSPL